MRRPTGPTWRISRGRQVRDGGTAPSRPQDVDRLL